MHMKITHKKNSSVKANTNKRSTKRKIMAGPGSGITLELRDITFTDVPSGGFYQAYDINYHDFLEPEHGYCKGTIDIKSIGTYYDGGDPGLGDIPVNVQVVKVQPDTPEEGKEMLGASLEDVIDEISDIDKTVNIGGGWTRSTFNGKFDLSAYSYAYGADILLKVEIADKDIVDFLDRFAHGDTVEMYYDICINGDYQGLDYENMDDAIETAKKYADDPQYADDEITVVVEHFNTDFYGETTDYYDDDGDVVWNSNDALYE